MITREKDRSEGTTTTSTTRYKTTIIPPTTSDQEHYNNNNNNCNNETIVTLRIPKSYYKTAYAVSHLLGFKSFDEYVSDTVMQNVFMHIDGAGSLSIDNNCIETQELLEDR